MVLFTLGVARHLALVFVLALALALHDKVSHGIPGHDILEGV